MLSYDIPISIFRAVKNVAIEHNINMLYIKSEPVNKPIEYHKQSNILYNVISDQNLDGLVLMSNILGMYISQRELIDLCNQYDLLPVVSMGMILDGIPSVIIDNSRGMYTAVSHLIEVHNKHRIGFVRGPREHPDAQERYNAYVTAMRDYNLDVDPDLVLPGNFYFDSGQAAIFKLIDERKKKPGKDLDALIFANDYMAIGAIGELHTRGFGIPEDIAITGFDDITSARYYNPTLSTVRQSFDEMGRQAALLLLSRIAGEKVPEIFRIPAKFIQHRSCGCTDKKTNEMSDKTQLPGDVATVLHTNTEGFLHHLNKKMFYTALPRKNLTAWNSAISMLRHPKQWEWGEPEKGNTDTFGQQAWTGLGTAAYMVFQSYTDIKNQLNTGSSLISTLDIPEIMNILLHKLPEFGIRTCFVSLYENPVKTTDPSSVPGWSRMILAFDEEKKINLPPEGLRYPTISLVPVDILKTTKPYRLVLQALYFREEQIGFWLLDAGIKDEMVYEVLNEQLSIAIEGALLLHQFEKQSREVAAANKEIQVLNEQLQNDNLKISTEMDVARHIQLALLPDEIKNIHPDFEIAARMITATEVGGDYYDISLDKEGTLWLGIGDVSGHGVTSGLIMMMARTVHTTITTNYKASAREIVIMVNSVLYKNVHERMGEHRFMTFTTLKYKGKGRFEHAGLHLDLLVYRNRKKYCERIETSGTWLNMRENISKYTKNSEFHLEIGDILILFTDGLTEIFNKDRKLLDMQGFKEIVTKHAEKDVEEIQDAIFKDVTDWCDGEPRDDMSIIIVKRIH